MFLSLGEVALCKGCPLCPSSTLSSCHPRVPEQVLITMCGLSSTDCGVVVFLLLVSTWWAGLSQGARWLWDQEVFRQPIR